MSYSQENGYTPKTVQEIISQIRIGINTQFGTTYDEITFAGTGLYKYVYAIAQLIQRDEITTSEVFLKLQEFISTTNEAIQRPSVSYPGIIESFLSNGYRISVDPITEANKGTIAICVDVKKFEDDGVTELPTWPATRLEIATMIKDFVAAGIVSLGTETENIVISNGQDFDFKFYLPNRIDVLLRATIDISDNTLAAVPSDEIIRQQILDNIAARYKMGWDFEPQRYYTQNDATWAGEIILEYSFDSGSTWESEIYQADFQDLFTFGLEDIAVVLND